MYTMYTAAEVWILLTSIHERSRLHLSVRVLSESYCHICALAYFLGLLARLCIGLLSGLAGASVYRSTFRACWRVSVEVYFLGLLARLCIGLLSGLAGASVYRSTFWACWRVCV